MADQGQKVELRMIAVDWYSSFQIWRSPYVGRPVGLSLYHRVCLLQPVFLSHFTIPETWHESIKEKQSIKLMSTQRKPSRTTTAINGPEKTWF
jgi:hypothetical protein